MTLVDGCDVTKAAFVQGGFQVSFAARYISNRCVFVSGELRGDQSRHQIESASVSHSYLRIVAWQSQLH
jgi:hypothetical protein